MELSNKQVHERTWTMNCILFGAKIAKLLDDKEKAIGEIMNLTSLFDRETAEYLYMRLIN